MTIDTEYANTDLELKSKTPLETLYRELGAVCLVLNYTQEDDGHWHLTLESSQANDTSVRDAPWDILAMIEAINALSPAAKAEFNACYLREFDIGFNCGDTWAYVHKVPSKVIREIANVGCSIAVTLYPVLSPDCKPQE